MASPNPNPTPEAEPLRDWAELPHDLLLEIFKKAGAIAVLTAAQFVCRPWSRVSFDPSLWRLIDMTAGNLDMEGLARDAIDRARGRVEEFCGGDFTSDRLLSHLADRASDLRCLRLINAFSVSDKGLTEALGRFSQLEELELTFGSFTKDLFKLVGSACPHLRCFRYIHRSDLPLRFFTDDSDPFGVADCMPKLRQLQLVGCTISHVGLTAILDRCIHLEALDISLCYCIYLNATVVAKCAMIKDLRLPEEDLAIFNPSGYDSHEMIIDLRLPEDNSPVINNPSDFGLFDFSAEMFPEDEQWLKI